MKKITIILSLCLVLVASFAYAETTLADLLDKTDLAAELSNGVEGDYSTNTEQTAFAISTAHAQGNKVYATGNFVTTIYIKDASDPFVSTDLLGNVADGNFNSSTFTGSSSDWSAIGD